VIFNFAEIILNPIISIAYFLEEQSSQR